MGVNKPCVIGLILIWQALIFASSQGYFRAHEPDEYDEHTYSDVPEPHFIRQKRTAVSTEESQELDDLSHLDKRDTLDCGDEYRCDYGSCIPLNKICDHEYDCADHSDEKNCGPPTNCMLTRGFMSCNENSCLGKERLCDGFNDCNDGSDEGSGCGEECDSSFLCVGECMKTPNGTACLCGAGYEKGRRLCRDINECLDHPCDHDCINTDGSYKCICFDGYELVDNKYCKEKMDEEAVFYYAIGSRIKFSKGGNESMINVFRETIISVAVDYEKNTIYCASPSKIMKIERSKFNYSIHRSYNPGQFDNIVNDMLFDPVDDNLYVIGRKNGDILICSTTKYLCVERLVNASAVSIAMDHIERRIFYLDREGELYSIDNDNSHPHEINKGKNGRNLAFDRAAQKLYYTSGPNYVAFDLKSKSTYEFYNKDLSEAKQIEVYEDYVYWIHKNGRDFYKSDKLTGMYKQIEKHASSISAFYIHKPTMKERKGNCAETYCSHVCISKRSDDRYSFCKCPIGMELSGTTSCTCPAGTQLEFVEGQQTCLQVKGCEDNQFACKSGQCIPQIWVCDGKNDCEDDSDEISCIEASTNAPVIDYTCNSSNSNLFFCSNTSDKCIPKQYICDSENDCPNGEDERNCCKEYKKYKCDNDYCIDYTLVCNGLNDCGDNSDENGKCNKGCEGNNCSYTCQRSPRGFRCICPDNYHLKDKSTCVDINECEKEINVCDHYCENNEGGYECYCAPYFTPVNDSCVVNNSPFMFFSVGKSIYMVDLHAGGRLVVTEANAVVSAFAFDVQEYMIYYAVDKGIYKTHTSNRETDRLYIQEGIENVSSMAFDEVGRNLYIMDNKANHILVCAVHDDSFVPCTVLIKHLKNPKSLIISHHTDTIYFTDIGLEGKEIIHMFKLDGKKNSDIAPHSNTQAIALDYPVQRMYYFNMETQGIESIFTNGKSLKFLLSANTTKPTSAAVWGSNLYWTDGDHNCIYFCDKKNGKQQKKFSCFEESPTNLKIFYRVMHAYNREPCLKNNEQVCSQICIVSSRERGAHECKCADEFHLLADKSKCNLNSDADEILLYVNGLFVKVQFFEYGNIVTETWNTKKNFGLKTVNDMDLDRVNDIIFCADNKGNKIVGISLRSEIVMTKHVREPISLSVDWIRGNLYWLEHHNNLIQVSLLDKEFVYRINLNLRSPTEIVISPLDNFLFVIDDFGIVKSRLDGKGKERIFKSSNVKSLYMDSLHAERAVYWVSVSQNQIFKHTIGKNITDELWAPSNTNKIVKTLRNTIAYSLISGNVNYRILNKSNGSRVYSMNKAISTPASSIHVVNLNNVNKLNVLPDYYNPCPNEVCSQFCFSTHHNTICGCGDGYSMIKGNYTFCVQNERNCTAEEFKCSNNKCIPSSLKCNNHVDCEDGSDEVKCSTSCPNKDDFYCINKCISNEKLCNGLIDCLDASDESAITCRYECRGDTRLCDNGACVLASRWCDTHSDCSDASDEKYCHCPNKQQNCGNGQCVNYNKWCNGEIDCTNGKDEANCSGECEDHEFNCKMDLCLPMNKTCDGIEDCPNGLDETGKCHFCDEGKCQHLCLIDVHEPKCDCLPGYKLIDEFHCSDINECAISGKSLCSHNCRNTIGSYQCICPPELTLDKDNKTCIDGFEGRIIVVSSVNAYFFTPELSPVTDINFNMERHYKEVIYLKSKHELIGLEYRGNLDTLEVDGVVKKMEFNLLINCMTYDFWNEVFYMTVNDELLKGVRILICNKNLHSCSTIHFEKHATIEAIKVSSQHRKLFYCKYMENGTSFLIIANADHTHYTSILQIKSKCLDIAIDEINQQIFWIDFPNEKIWFSSWYGSDQIIFTPVSNLGTKILVVNNFIYYINADNKGITRCDMYTKDCNRTVSTKFPIYSMLSPPRLRLHGESPCSHSNCPYTCVFNDIVDKKFKCLCSDKQFKVKVVRPCEYIDSSFSDYSKQTESSNYGAYVPAAIFVPVIIILCFLLFILWKRKYIAVPSIDFPNFNVLYTSRNNETANICQNPEMDTSMDSSSTSNVNIDPDAPRSGYLTFGNPNFEMLRNPTDQSKPGISGQSETSLEKKSDVTAL